MARPQKNSCDYFTHDNDMRNHRKVKSIRNKFGIQGYAVWSMLLEYLTGIDGNEFEYSDLEFELISGDFGVSVTEIQNVVDYCIKLEMLFVNNGFVYSESLNNRLAPVYKKRGVAKEISEKQKRNKGKFTNSTVATVVSVTETPQSKVNKSKEKKIKEEDSFSENSENEIPAFVKFNRSKITPAWGGRLEKETLKADFMQNDYCRMQSSRDGVAKDDYEKTVDDFLFEKFGLQENEDWKDLKDARSHFVRWIPFYLKKQKTNEGFSAITVHKGGYGEQSIDNRNPRAAW